MSNLGGNGNGDDNWKEYRRLVLAELERLHNEIEALKLESKNRDIRQAALTAKLTVYSAIGAILGGACVTYVVDFISR